MTEDGAPDVHVLFGLTRPLSGDNITLFQVGIIRFRDQERRGPGWRQRGDATLTAPVKAWATVCVTLAMACGVVPAGMAGDQAFFRVSAQSNTVIRSFSETGYLSWSNEMNSGTCVVQIADSLPGTNVWRSFIRVPVTGTVMQLHLVNLNTPSNMVYIPAGPFDMGNSFVNGDCGEQGELIEVPVHTVVVGDFYIEKYEVTKSLWDRVKSWAVTNGYDFSANSGASQGASYPVGSNSWYDCVKWCNARSEMEGLTPCYYTNSSRSVVYRQGSLDLFTNRVNWNVTGYRLPTEAEWEKACRGGAAGTRFPWGDTITHSNANYFSSEYFSTNSYTNAPLCFYDVSPTRGYHPSCTNNGQPYTAPVGSFAPNGYGLYDMIGNVNEWCWDFYGTLYYSSSPAEDPIGPSSSTFESYRVLRGGGWHGFDATLYRCAYRIGNPPYEVTDNRGFRCVRSRLE